MRGRLLWLLAGWLQVSGAGAQVPFSPEGLSIDTAGVLLQQATVVGRRDELVTSLPYRVEVIAGNDIRQVQQLTTADALATLGGVYVQKSQLGGGSPVVRGFEANRVLLVVDGVRMNNAIYRNGHLQNAITVDPNALEQTEIIYGAGALAYGSDALGGVIHFRTRRPDYRPAGGSSGSQTLNLSSAARAVNAAGTLAYGGRDWSGLTAYAVTRFGNLRAGGNRPDNYGNFGLRTEYVVGDSVVTNDRPARQIGSGYHQYNLLQKLRLRTSERTELSANLQLSTTGDVPRYDALTERRDGRLRWARWDYGPQTRTLASLRFADRRPTRLYDVGTYQLSHQYVEEDRYQRRLGDPVWLTSEVNVHVWNLQVDYAKALTGRTDLRYGFDLRRDAVAATSSPDDEPTRYPSRGSGLTAGGAYLDLAYDLGPKWQLRGGLRYARQRLHATFGTDDPVAWPAAYTRGIVSVSDAVTGAVGMRYAEGPHRLRLLAAQGFRAPNVDDFAKFREQSGRIQVPNPALRPERSLTLDAAYGWKTAGAAITVGAYATRLTDAIIRRAGRVPDGRTFFISRGDTLRVDLNDNAERAWIYGFDLDLSYAFSERWAFVAAAHWLRGRRRQLAPDGAFLDLPQDHIPPAYGHAGLRYHHRRFSWRLRCDGQLRKPLEQYSVNMIGGNASDGYTLDRVGSADNPELTPGGRGTPAWWTLATYATYRLADSGGELYFKVENLLDRFYQPFAGGIAAPGVDVGIGVHWAW